MEYRSILLVLALLGSAAAAAAAEEAYRWVDEEGVVHYSDRPREGAERILLPAPNVARTRRVESPRGQQPADDIADETPPGYQAIEIVSPGSEETLWNIEGVLSVSVSLTPPLQPGHRIRAYHNGVGQMVSGASFQLEEVWRGEHNLQVEVLDATGKLLIRSQPSRFYVQQNTVGF
jgi:hypothetical protein